MCLISATVDSSTICRHQQSYLDDNLMDTYVHLAEEEHGLRAHDICSWGPDVNPYVQSENGWLFHRNLLLLQQWAQLAWLAGGFVDQVTAEWGCCWQFFLSSLCRISWSGGEGCPARSTVQLELDFCFVTGVCSTLYLEVSLSLNLMELMDLAKVAG